MAIDYKQAGVDVEAGYAAVKMMKEYVKKTYDKNVLGDLGSFGGFYALDDKPDGDVLVAGTDGVGTKLKYAFIADKHDTVGIDAVAMCVNDIVCQGAKPLLFLDYIAIPKLVPEKVATIVKGVSEGCLQSQCALIGGETAEMPGFYAENEYDIAGFAVGIAKKNNIINGKTIKAGNALVGLESSGLHSNGFSLVRKLFGESVESVAKHDSRLGGNALGALLMPTRIYVKSILAAIEKFNLLGIAHITGGGFIENIPRILPQGLAAKVDLNSYKRPELFNVIKELSGLDDKKLCNTFNMGIGMVIAIEKEQAAALVEFMNSVGEKAHIIGEVVEGEGVIL